MSRLSPRTTLTTALLLAGALGLAACANDGAAPGAAASQSSSGSAATAARNEGSARFVFAYDGGVKVLDADTLDEVADLPLGGFNRLNAYGDGEHVAVSTEGGFRILSTGARGGSPALTPLKIPATTPGHVVVHSGKTVFFDDGTGLIQVLDTDALGDSAQTTPSSLPEAKTIESADAHHGVAVVLADGSVVRTIGTSQARTGALVQDASGAEIARSEECPGVHGEGVASNEVAAIGCQNGVLLWDGEAFTKLASPDADYGRIGNEYTSPASTIVVTDYNNDEDAEGVTLSQLGFVDTEAKTFTVIDMPEGVEYTWRGVRRDADGGAWVLGTDGGLYPVDVDTMTIGAPIEVAGPWSGPEKWQNAHPALTIEGRTAWVTEPATKSVHRVDLDARTIETAVVGVEPNEVALATGMAPASR